MRFLNFKTYFKFLFRNKLYTVVNILGFAISIMFVFLLGTYVKNEFSVDRFHEKKDRIYLLASSPNYATWANPVGSYIENLCPEVESYTRIVQQQANFKYGNVNTFYKATFADPSFFNIFSFELLVGNPSEVLATKTSAVITRSFANKIFPGEDPMGKTFFVDDLEVTVTGIMSDLPYNTQIGETDFVCNYDIIQRYWGSGILEDWGNCSFTIFFLEKEGADLRSKEEIIVEDFKKFYWLYEMKYRNDIKFIPLEDSYFIDLSTSNIKLKSNSKSLMYTYLAITILILVVAILNYINLSVSQIGSRGKEAAIKKLLGSSKKYIIYQFISETVLMTLFASITGILLAFAAQPFFNDVLNTNLNLVQNFNFLNVLLILILIFLIGIVSGLFPSLVVSKFKPIEVVKGSFSLKVKTFYSKILITFQYVVALTLLICSIFLVMQNNYMKNYDLGFDKNRVFIMDNVLDSVKIKGFKNELLKIPGVESISYSMGTPLDGGNNNSFEYNGEPVSFQMFEADSSFFNIYGIERYQFANNGSNSSIWLNQKAYDVLQPDSITHEVKGILGGGITVSGITSEFKFRTLHTPVEPAMIFNNENILWPWSISVKISDNANLFSTADKVKETYTKYNGGEIFESQFVDDIVQKNYEREDKISKIIIAFSTLTIIILMMGMLAMSLYYVRQKEKEIAIRKVNGANEKKIMYMLNMNFIKWIIVAIIIAIPLSYFVMQKWLENFAYRISLSWWVFVLAGSAVVLLSVIFVSLQSWKTAVANPVKSLKNE